MPPPESGDFRHEYRNYIASSDIPERFKGPFIRNVDSLPRPFDDFPSELASGVAAMEQYADNVVQTVRSSLGPGVRFSGNLEESAYEHLLNRPVDATGGLTSVVSKLLELVEEVEVEEEQKKNSAGGRPDDNRLPLRTEVTKPYVLPTIPEKPSRVKPRRSRPGTSDARQPEVGRTPEELVADGQERDLARQLARLLTLGRVEGGHVSSLLALESLLHRPSSITESDITLEPDRLSVVAYDVHASTDEPRATKLTREIFRKEEHGADSSDVPVGDRAASGGAASIEPRMTRSSDDEVPKEAVRELPLHLPTVERSDAKTITEDKNGAPRLERELSLTAPGASLSTEMEVITPRQRFDGLQLMKHGDRAFSALVATDTAGFLPRLARGEYGLRLHGDENGFGGLVRPSEVPSDTIRYTRLEKPHGPDHHTDLHPVIGDNAAGTDPDQGHHELGAAPEQPSRLPLYSRRHRTDTTAVPEASSVDGRTRLLADPGPGDHPNRRERVAADPQPMSVPGQALADGPLIVEVSADSSFPQESGREPVRLGGRYEEISAESETLVLHPGEAVLVRQASKHVETPVSSSA